jgi:hypothetical protein
LAPISNRLINSAASFIYWRGTRFYETSADIYQAKRFHNSEYTKLQAKVYSTLCGFGQYS